MDQNSRESSSDCRKCSQLVCTRENLGKQEIHVCTVQWFCFLKACASISSNSQQIHKHFIQSPIFPYLSVWLAHPLQWSSEKEDANVRADENIYAEYSQIYAESLIIPPAYSDEVQTPLPLRTAKPYEFAAKRTSPLHFETLRRKIKTKTSAKGWQCRCCRLEMAGQMAARIHSHGATWIIAPAKNLKHRAPPRVPRDLNSRAWIKKSKKGIERAGGSSLLSPPTGCSSRHD